MKHPNRLISILFMSVFVMACSCKPAMKAPSNDLRGEWVLNYISGPRIAFEGLYPKQKPTLIFTDSKTEVSGNTSCNGFSGPLKIEGTQINFGDIRSTMMACEGIGEPTFVNMLKKINKYSVSENTLTLITGDIAMMRFTKSK